MTDNTIYNSTGDLKSNIPRVEETNDKEIQTYDEYMKDVERTRKYFNKKMMYYRHLEIAADTIRKLLLSFTYDYPDQPEEYKFYLGELREILRILEVIE